MLTHVHSYLKKIQHVLLTPSKKAFIIASIAFCLLIICVASALFYLTFFRAPATFPETAVVVVPRGKSLASIAETLQQEHIIRSPFWFTNFVMIFDRERQVVGGEYYFEQSMNVYQIAKRVTRGSYNTEQLKTTIPEGSTIVDISLIIKKHYPLFDTVHFVTLAEGKEGFLFPDTYYFGADATPETVLAVLTSTFNKKVQQQDVQEAVSAFGRPLADIVTMASILEGEARQMETRRLVAGILWERIRQGIPLQVDAAFRYVNGKTTEQLTLADLKIDSPYNTYVYKGLTPTPISNPGLDSIIAAATPIETDYLYFLTDDEGVMHYAKTLQEHVQNKKKYLGK